MPRTYWYHGGQTANLRPDRIRWDRDRTTSSLNAEGPGIYFTTDLVEAQSYGLVVVRATLPRSMRVMHPSTPPRPQALRAFFGLAPEGDQVRFLEDWGVDSPSEALRNYEGDDSLLDAYVDLYGDLLHFDADEYVRIVRALGWDAAEVPRKQARHMVLWSPEKLGDVWVM